MTGASASSAYGNGGSVKGRAMEFPFELNGLKRGIGAPALPSPAAGGPDQDGLNRCCLLQSRRQLRCAKVSAPAVAASGFTIGRAGHNPGRNDEESARLAVG